MLQHIYRSILHNDVIAVRQEMAELGQQIGSMVTDEDYKCQRALLQACGQRCCRLPSVALVVTHASSLPLLPLTNLPSVALVVTYTR